ncbi:uncharacterized protein EV422DRAFT_36161 [Fimicolochytrium jonesii]|uniref:uncharacterized protein n=1 Tax=Fimicolochytrium jonesii TaxID=1396493 RepID=UPI0022FF0D56|nr:uncharacterized protein EV422DRAFT_36161 [Fimicolochytrium jonesii]KAI8821283.1 hypothetical protein EV422DRAFT_36161 [Fimicolochytrium jonesii]
MSFCERVCIPSQKVTVSNPFAVVVYTGNFTPDTDEWTVSLFPGEVTTAAVAGPCVAPGNSPPLQTWSSSAANSLNWEQLTPTNAQTQLTINPSDKLNAAIKSAGGHFFFQIRAGNNQNCQVGPWNSPAGGPGNFFQLAAPATSTSITPTPTLTPTPSASVASAAADGSTTVTPTPTPVPQPQTPPSSGIDPNGPTTNDPSSGKGAPVAMIAGITAAAIVLLAIAGLVFARRRNRSRTAWNRNPDHRSSKGVLLASGTDQPSLNRPGGSDRGTLTPEPVTEEIHVGNGAPHAAASIAPAATAGVATAAALGASEPHSRSIPPTASHAPSQSPTVNTAAPAENPFADPSPGSTTGVGASAAAGAASLTAAAAAIPSRNRRSILASLHDSYRTLTRADSASTITSDIENPFDPHHADHTSAQPTTTDPSSSVSSSTSQLPPPSTNAHPSITPEVAPNTDRHTMAMLVANAFRKGLSSGDEFGNWRGGATNEGAAESGGEKVEQMQQVKHVEGMRQLGGGDLRTADR